MKLESILMDSGSGNGSVLTITLGAASAYLDGLTRFKDHWFNAGNAPLYAKVSSILTFVSAIYSVVATLANPNLSMGEKIRDIINIGSAIAMIGISAVMAYLTLAAANPVLLGIVLATIAITLSLLIMNLQAELASSTRRTNLVRVSRYV